MQLAKREKTVSSLKLVQDCEKSDRLAMPIIADVSGNVQYGDLVRGVTFDGRMVIENKAQDLRPRITIKDPNGTTLKLPNTDNDARYLLAVGVVILVKEGPVKAGEVIAIAPAIYRIRHELVLTAGRQQAFEAIMDGRVKREELLKQLAALDKHLEEQEAQFNSFGAKLTEFLSK